MRRASSFRRDRQYPFIRYSTGSPSGAARTASITAPGTNPSANSRLRTGPGAGTETTRQVPGGRIRSSVVRASHEPDPSGFFSGCSMQEYQMFGADNGEPKEFREPHIRSNILRVTGPNLIAKRTGPFLENTELYIHLHPKKSPCIRSAGKRRITWKLS